MNRVRRKPIHSSHQRGVALMLVLIAVALSVILAVTFSEAQSASLGIAGNSQNHARARAITESALGMAIAYVRANDDWRTAMPNGAWVTNQAFDSGTFTLTGQDGTIGSAGTVVGDADLTDDSTEKVTLTAVGKYKNVTHRISAVLTPTIHNVGNLLLVVVNSASPTAGETTRKTLAESWGWTVSYISQNATQASFDAAVTINDVIYISATVTDSTVAAKLLSSPLGIVCEAGDLQVGLGLTNSAGTSTSTNTITVLDSENPIVESFDPGDLVICSSNQPLYKSASSIAADAQVLANPTSGSNAMIAVLEDGDTLKGGGIAAGARAFMPWGTSAFDINSLNTDGRYLLRSALEWAGQPSVEVVNSVSGVAARVNVFLYNSATINSFNSADGAYTSLGSSSTAVASTNSTKKNKIYVRSGTSLKGDAQILSSANTNVVNIQSGSTFTGQIVRMNSAVNIPKIIIPTGLPATSGDVTYSSGTTVINANKTFGKLTIKSGAIVQIQGTVIIYCTGAFLIQDASQLQLAPGAKLSLYLKNTFTASNTAQINTTGYDSTAMTMYGLTRSYNFNFNDTSQTYATVVGYNVTIIENTSAKLMGNMLVKTIKLNDSSLLSQDRRTLSYGTDGSNAAYTYTVRWYE